MFFSRSSSPGLLPLILALSALFGYSSGQDRPADLDRVLSSKPELSIFWGLVNNNTDYLFQLPTVGGVTIIAPNNDSFARIQNFDPKNKTAVNALLQYHTLQGSYPSGAIAEGKRVFAATKLTDRRYTNVTSGQQVTIDKQRGGDVVVTSGAGSRSTLVETDLQFAGGVVHIADALLTAPQRLEATGLVGYRNELSAFVAALYAADLVPQFADLADVTIFAPANAALQLLGPTLTALDKEALRRVMAYHLVPGKVLPAESFQNGTKLPTAADGARAQVTVHRAGNQLYVNSARVIAPDILIANGVLHIVDGVLNPDAPAALPNPESDSQPPVFALTADGGKAGSTGVRAPTPFTSALPCTANCPTPTSSSSSRRATSTTSVATSSSQGAGAAGPGSPRCTGAAFVGAAAAAFAAAGVLGGVV